MSISVKEKVEAPENRTAPSRHFNRYTATYEKTDDGWWVATLLEIPGVFTQGKTLDEARENLQDAAALMLESYRDDARREHSEREGVVEELTEEILVEWP